MKIREEKPLYLLAPFALLVGAFFLLLALYGIYRAGAWVFR